MVERIADHVHQRISHHLHHVLVDLGIFSRKRDRDFLAKLLRKVAHQPHHFLEHRTYGNEAHGHGHLLKAARDTIKLGEITVKTLIADRHDLRALHHLRLKNNKLTDHINKRIKFLELYLDRRLDRCRRLLRGQSAFHLLRARRMRRDQDLTHLHI